MPPCVPKPWRLLTVIDMFSFTELIDFKKRPLVMGILNVTPDSFWDGGEYFTVEKAVEKAKQLEFQGADIIDIGACSTSPEAAFTSLDEELDRLCNVFSSIRKNVGVPLSIDTFRIEAANLAFENGADIFNDESGKIEMNRLELSKAYGGGYVFMHTGNSDSATAANYQDGVLDDVLNSFGKVSELAKDCQMQHAVCYDCGIGFGKTRRDDLTLLREMNKLADFSPLLVGISRKRVVGEAIGEAEPRNRIYGTVAAEAAACLNGARIIRAHDVKAALDAVKMSQAIIGGKLNG